MIRARSWGSPQTITPGSERSILWSSVDPEHQPAERTKRGSSQERGSSGRSGQRAVTSATAFATPSHGSDLPLVHALDSKLAQLVGLGTLQVARAADGPLHKTLCLLLKREYKCLAGLRYTPPAACAGVI